MPGMQERSTDDIRDINPETGCIQFIDGQVLRPSQVRFVDAQPAYVHPSTEAIHPPNFELDGTDTRYISTLVAHHAARLALGNEAQQS